MTDTEELGGHAPIGGKFLGGGYVVETELGEGAMARVYRVRHEYLDTLHAMKVLKPHFRAIPDVRRRFVDEAKIQARYLEHLNIVRVTDIVANEGLAALVMEYVDGPNLERHIAESTTRPTVDDVRALMLPSWPGSVTLMSKGSSIATSSQRTSCCEATRTDVSSLKSRTSASQR